MGKVLIVDDQQAVRTALEMLFELAGMEFESVSSPEEALVRVQRGGVAVVVQDMNFSHGTTSGEEGVELFRAIRALNPQIPVLLMTAWTCLETAVMLVKEGADDYIEKPWDDRKLTLAVSNLLRLHSLSQQNEALVGAVARARGELGTSFDLCGVVYASRAMHEVVSLAVHTARSDSPVLITGPNGSGKEKLAEIIQQNSARKGKPFVRVNAGALPDSLIEAELFGAEAGAFTGAGKMRIGLFEAADGGTLFLDEIGNLSLAGQIKLLRVLETGDYQRLGSATPRKANVRILSATNADLREAIAQKSFREDLYFRLNVIELRVPPLAERPDDVAALACAILAGRSGGPFELSEDAVRAMHAHAWPGNVRELRNRLERATLVAKGPRLEPPDLALPRAPARIVSGSSSEEGDIPRATLEEVLTRNEGNVSRAASELGLSRQALYRRMERLGLSVQRRLKIP
ncbi:sigma-54 dependent transcriptional regulator [Pendulispora rubella]|uniref:Sigma-54 dependent transcriptional regulator n=1 Tax=Pendulispora rubella TaxID=2741070 RepID=A0ABZ2L875_9BACT